ncbi:MAG TPA: AAA family ATPase [Gaiellaceae bacterium]|nr:AAA family ATPase [Gaiellaceae bacterium]
MVRTGFEESVERPLRESGRRRHTHEGGLPELIEALRWRWKPTLLIAVLFTAGATIYVESLQSQYDGRSVVAISPRANAPAAGSDTVRVLAPKYVRYVTAPSTVAEVAPRIGEDPEEIEDAINASIATDTGNLEIVVRLPSPQRSARAANAFADAAVAFSQDDPLLVGQIVARALPDDEPASPPRRLLEAASLFVGLLLGIVVSLLLERGKPRLRTWRDLARLTGYPVVGRVPPSRTVHTNPTRAFSDAEASSAFRILRANLEPQIREGGLDFLLVTSPLPGDGKTTTAALLSESLSLLGMRVLLVDADLRRPGIAKMARIASEPGLSNVLRGETSLSEAVRGGWAQNLFVLSTRLDPDAGDLLSRRFADLVEEARSRFDVIVVDTPPLLSADDPRTLATMAKGILLVVSAGSTVSSVNDAIIAVEALNAPLVGIIGNRFKESGPANYY